jgi:hypothetical protein
VNNSFSMEIRTNTTLSQSYHLIFVEARPGFCASKQQMPLFRSWHEPTCDATVYASEVSMLVGLLWKKRNTGLGLRKIRPHAPS